MPSSTPAAQFDYDKVGVHYILLFPVLMLLESLFPVSSADPHVDEVPRLGVSQQSSVSPPVTSPTAPRPEDNFDTPKSSQGIMILKRWLPTRIKKGNKDSTLDKPDLVPRESRQAADHQSRSQSLVRVEATNEGPSWMVPGQRRPVSAVP